MKKNKIIFLGLVLFIYFWIAFSATAASYDLYVDKSYDGEEEGTPEKPFKTIGKALENASENEKIYINIFYLT